MLNGEELARELLFKEAAVRSRTGAPVKWFQGHAEWLILQKVLVHVGRNVIDWLELQVEGVYVEGLHGMSYELLWTDHVITVDGKSRNFWDPAEKLGLRSEPAVFEACVGDGFEFYEIMELRTIDRQNAGRRKAMPRETT